MLSPRLNLFPQLLAQVFHHLAYLAAGFAEVGLDVAADALIDAFALDERIAEGAAELLLHRTGSLVDVALHFVIIDTHV